MYWLRRMGWCRRWRCMQAPLWCVRVMRCARGRVVARCWQQVTVRIPLQETISRETGRSETAYQLCTPWFCYPAQVETPAYLTGQLYRTDTPVGGEVALSLALRPEQQVRTEAEAAARKRLHASLRGFRITDEQVESRNGGDGYVYATAACEYPTDLCLASDGTLSLPE